MSTTPNPRPERLCDLVMKGGITSGVVYPLAASELAKISLRPAFVRSQSQSVPFLPTAEGHQTVIRHLHGCVRQWLGRVAQSIVCCHQGLPFLDTARIIAGVILYYVSLAADIGNFL